MPFARLKKWILGESEEAAPAVTPEQRGNNDQFLDAISWIILGRSLDEENRRSFGRRLEMGQDRNEIVLACFSSIEFQSRRSEWELHPDEDINDPDLTRALDALGSNEQYVRMCYEWLLGREADDVGLQNHVGLLQAGRKRVEIIRGLVLSDEFASRYKEICPAGGDAPVDVQLCELANPAKWDNPEWIALLRSIGGLSTARRGMHRKAYEFTQTVYGLQRLGLLTENARILSVGAGHEAILYWLANRVAKVVATDLYEGKWQDKREAEGNDRVLTNPEEYAPYPYRKDHLMFMKMDGRDLTFRDESFDAVYSLSSIEHFGGVKEAKKSVEEMVRVLRPGGVLALATEWLVVGPPSPEVFMPHQVKQLIDVPGAELIEPIDERVWKRYRVEPVDLKKNPYQTPHMLVKDGDTIFTSVMVFLRRTAAPEENRGKKKF